MKRYPWTRAARIEIAISVAALVMALAAPRAAAAQDHEHPAGEVLGHVTFPISCKAEVVPQFERAVAMLHSFWFTEATETFAQVATADPTCAMAHWGTAMTLMGNPMTRTLPNADALRRGLAAAEKARELAARQSHREQMYADAVVAYYGGEGLDFASRMGYHEESMAALHRTHADDPEATIFYGRAVVAAAPTTDLTFARQITAAELLEPLFERFPEHPGLAHYLIHAYDAPALANRARDAAFAYADIAPSAPHALHMPSHIFTRLGFWKESIATNSRSAQAEPEPNTAVHPMDYMTYAYLQLGRDTEAKDVVDRSSGGADRLYGGTTGYNFAAMPARYALERSAWTETAALRIPAGAPPQVEAITHFARAIGAARSGTVAAIQPEIDALASLEARLRQANDNYWATIVGAQRLAASAWAAHARGDDAGAVRLAGEAADLEETVEKHPVTPGPILPARELQGDLLLELRRPAEALRAYEATLVREPNRARTLYGAARAAEQAGDAATARARYTALLELMGEADATRPEVRAAREFLGR